MSSPSTDLIERWRQGDEQAATDLCNRYFERLLQQVNDRLARKYLARFDAADVCQSAMRSMFRRVREDEYEFQHDGGVWNLLLEITLNKMRNRVRHENAQRRNLNREQAQGNDEENVELIHGLSREPSGEDAVAFRDLVGQVLERLSREEQRYIVLQLRGGYSQKEIAQKLKLSSRTIRRLPVRIRSKVADLLGAEASLPNPAEEP